MEDTLDITAAPSDTVHPSTADTAELGQPATSEKLRPDLDYSSMASTITVTVDGRKFVLSGSGKKTTSRDVLKALESHVQHDLSSYALYEVWQGSECRLKDKEEPFVLRKMWKKVGRKVVFSAKYIDPETRSDSSHTDSEKSQMKSRQQFRAAVAMAKVRPTRKETVDESNIAKQQTCHRTANPIRTVLDDRDIARRRRSKGTEPWMVWKEYFIESPPTSKEDKDSDSDSQKDFEDKDDDNDSGLAHVDEDSSTEFSGGAQACCVEEEKKTPGIVRMSRILHGDAVKACLQERAERMAERQQEAALTLHTCQQIEVDTSELRTCVRQEKLAALKELLQTLEAIQSTEDTIMKAESMEARLHMELSRIEEDVSVEETKLQQELDAVTAAIKIGNELDQYQKQELDKIRRVSKELNHALRTRRLQAQYLLLAYKTQLRRMTLPPPLIRTLVQRQRLNPTV